jgi:hypothetical protein
MSSRTDLPSGSAINSPRELAVLAAVEHVNEQADHQPSGGISEDCRFEMEDWPKGVNH